MILKPATKTLCFIFLLFASFFITPSFSLASNNIACTVNSTCTIGEFLYNDNYSPTTDATCTLNGRDPDNVVFFNNVNAPHVSDGRYEKTFSTTALAEGEYQTQLCCLTGNQTLCIDKSFVINPASLSQTSIDNAITSIKGAGNKDLSQLDTAVGGVNTAVGNVNTAVGNVNTAVGNAVTSIKGTSNKDLSEVSTQVTGVKSVVDSIVVTLSTLVSDIWSNSTTSFNSLITSIWTASDRKLSSAALDEGSLATAANITATETSIKGASNKDLSQVNTNVDGVNTAVGGVNTAVGNVNTAVGNAVTSIKGTGNKDLTEVSGQVADIKVTVDSISSVVSSLNLQVSTISADVDTLLSNWESSSMSEVVAGLNGLAANIGATTDTCISGNTVLGRLHCLTDKWGAETANSIYTAAINAQTAAQNLSTELNYNGKSTTAYGDLQTLNSNLNTVASLIGSAGDTASEITIFGKIKQVQDTVETLNTSNTDLSGLLAKWGDYTATDIYDKVKDISSDISKINMVTNVTSILTKTESVISDQKDLKNNVYALQALIQANKTLLEKTANKPIIQSWLEEGSIIFKNLITNPSTTTRQIVPFKFYLPKEAKLSDIMKADPELSIDYDTIQGALAVTGNFELAPGETKILSVEVTDVWKITDTEIAAIQTQTAELFDVLKGTAYFAQGSTLKSDITVSLEKISRIQKEAETLESRIMAYRSASDELTKVKSEVNDLKELVSSVSSNKSLFGFVGGSQLLSVWGIVAIMLAGFAFLAIFIKKLLSNQQIKPTLQECQTVLQTQTVQPNKHAKFEKIAFASILLFIVAGSQAYLVSINKTPLISGEVKGLDTTKQETAPQATPTNTQETEAEFVRLLIDLEKLILKAQPNAESIESFTAIKGEIYPVQDTRLGDNGEYWYQLKNSKGSTGWGITKYFEALDSNNIGSSELLNTQTDNQKVERVKTIPEISIINIRSLPNVSSTVIQRIPGGISLKKLSEVGGWVEVEAPSTKNGKYYQTGWIQKALLSMVR